MTNFGEDSKKAGSLQDVVEHIRKTLASDGAMVTRIEGDKQLILASAGYSFPEEYQQAIPLDLSVCQHTIAMNFPLAIDDTIYHPLLRGSRAFDILRIAAYLGAPVPDGAGGAKAAVCAFQTRRRRWLESDTACILEAARMADPFLETSYDAR